MTTTSIRTVPLPSGRSFIIATDLMTFFPGCKTGRDIIQHAQVPDDASLYATYSPKQNVWKTSTKDVRVAKAMIDTEWALAHIAGLRAGPPGPPGPNSASASPTTTQTEAPAGQQQQQQQRGGSRERDEMVRTKLQIRSLEATLASALANERRAAELHIKLLDSIERKTVAYERATAAGHPTVGEF